MACDDRQLSEAQRVAGYQNQRTGVVQAVRPFSGKPTVDNLIDYINRELFPAIKATRNKVNDVHERVMDNAPSGNPLQFYFSEETAAADPTVGFIRLNQATQDTATVIRVSQTNGRLQDVAPWLDVMAGGATSPLGTITLSDVINPARFLRFDLNTMVDQGDYWDLGVTIIESSHDNPFVQDGGIAIAFTPGVASAGATVPPTAITPIAANTVLGNATASTAAPTAIPIGTNSVLGRVAGNIVADRIVTDQIADNQVDNTKIRNSAGLSVIGRASNSTGDPADIAASAALQHLRVNAAGTALEWGTLTLASLPSQASDTVLGNISGSAGTPTAVALADLDSTSIVYDATSHTFQRASLTGDVTASQNGNATTIANDAVTNAKLANMAAARVKGVQVDGATGDPQDLTGLEVGELLRLGTVQDTTLTATTNDLSLGADVTVLRLTSTTGAQTLTGITGGAAGRILFVENVSADGNPITLASLDAGSLAANRLRTPRGVATVLGFRESALLRWSATNNDWRVVATARATAIADQDYGDITVTANGLTWTIDNDVVSDAKLRNSAGLSVIGRAANSTGDPADITSTTARHALITNSAGTAIGWRALETADIPAHTWAEVLAAGAGSGANNPVIAAGQYIGFGASPPTLGLSERIRSDGALAAYATGDITIASTGAIAIVGDVDATNAGMALNTSGQVVLAHSSGQFVSVSSFLKFTTEAAASTPSMSAGQGLVWVRSDTPNVPMFTDDGNTDHVLQYRGEGMLADGDKGDITVSGSFLTWTIDNDVVTNAKLANMAQATVKGRALTAGTGDPSDLTATEVNTIVGSADLTLSNALMLGTSQVVSSAPPHTVTLNAATTRLFLTTGTAGTLQSVSGATAGRIVAVQPVFAALTVQHTASGTSSSGICCPGNVDFVCRVRDSFLLMGDGANGWLVIAAPVGRVFDGDKGDITVSGAGATWTIDNDVVTDAKLRDSAALSVIGRSANSTGDPADIAAANDHEVLRRNGTSIGFGTIALGAFPSIADDTFLANIGGSAAQPTAVALSTLAGDGLQGGANAVLNIDVSDFAGTGLEDDGSENLRIASSAAGNGLTGGGGSALAVGAGTNVTVSADAVSVDDYPLSGLADQAADTVVANVTAGSAAPTAHSLSTLAGGGLTYGSGIMAVGAGTGITVNANDIAVTIPLTDGDKGDITVATSGTVWTIDNDVVSNAKLANMAQARVKGRALTAGTGDPADLTASEVNAIVGSADLTLSNALMLGTSQVVSSAPPHTVTLNAAATRLFLTTGTAGTLQSVTGATAGRIVAVQPTAAALTVQHTNNGTSASGICCPGNVDMVCRPRDTFLLLGDGSNGWLVIAAPVGRVFDGDKGDITVSGSGATWTIDNDAVTDAKLRNSAALSVIGRSANSTGDPADIAAANDGEVLRRSGTTLGFGTVATAGIADGAVTLAKQANLAQSTIIGRAQGIGTGVPQALSAQQVADIVEDATTVAWIGTHTFDGPSFTVDAAIGDALIGANPGGVGLFSGQDTQNVTNGDLVLNSASGIVINATGTAVTSAGDGVVDVNGTTLDVDMTGNVTIDTPGNITIAASSTGATTVTGGSSGLILTAASTIGLNSPTVVNQILRFDSILTSTLGGNVDDLDVSNYNVVRLNPNAGARRLRGMVAGGDGQLVLLLNISTTNSFNIIDESDTVDGSSSAAANRFRLPSTTTQVLGTNGAVWMWYDGATDRWRMR